MSLPYEIVKKALPDWESECMGYIQVRYWRAFSISI